KPAALWLRCTRLLWRCCSSYSASRCAKLRNDISLASASASNRASSAEIAVMRRLRYWAAVCSSMPMGHPLASRAAKLTVRTQVQRWQGLRHRLRPAVTLIGQLGGQQIGFDLSGAQARFLAQVQQHVVLYRCVLVQQVAHSDQLVLIDLGQGAPQLLTQGLTEHLVAHQLLNVLLQLLAALGMVTVVVGIFNHLSFATGQRMPGNDFASLELNYM